MKRGANVVLSTISALIILSLLSFSAAALDFDVKIEPDQQTIKLTETALFTLSITHDSTDPQNFEIYSPDVQWDIETEPFTDKILNVLPYAAGRTTLKIRPLYVNPGYYIVPINIRPVGKNQLIQKAVIVGVTSYIQRSGEYLPAVRVVPKVPAEIDPRRSVSFEIVVENQNRKELSSVLFKIRSGTLVQDAKTSLAPFERKTLRFNVTLDPLTAPQKDALRVTTFADSEERTFQFDAEPAAFSIAEYGEIVSSETEERGFLKATKTVAFANTGNAKKTTTYRSPRTFLSSLVTSTEPDAVVVTTPEGSAYSFDVELDVGQTTTVMVVTNYRPILNAVIIIILIVVAYFIFRSPVVVKKSAVVVDTREGGISELKIILEVKNRSGVHLKGISVIDKVPRIAEVVREFEVGTIKPEKIVRDEEKGTLIKWVLDDLESFEERVIAYKIKSKLSILGDLQLPVAVAKFTTTSGSQRSTASNISQIGFGKF